MLMLYQFCNVAYLATIIMLLILNEVIKTGVLNKR